MTAFPIRQALPALAALLAPIAGREAAPIEGALAGAVDAGATVADLAGRLHDAITDEAFDAAPGPVLAELGGVGEELLKVGPGIVKAATALGQALGLDEAFAAWRARAPERRAARAARREARHVDTDGDGRPDVRDKDDDNDGTPDREDVAPKDPTQGAELGPDGEPVVVRNGRKYSADGKKVWFAGAWRTARGAA